MCSDESKDEIDISAHKYLGMWAAGRDESVSTLVSRMIDTVRSIYGISSIRVFSEELIAVKVDDILLKMRCKPGQLNIVAPKDFKQYDVVAWNRAITKFHSEIVEPIKDRIGAVASGIG